MADERFDTLGKIALTLCLLGLVCAIVVGVAALTQPRSWTSRDAKNTLLGIELLALFMGTLSRRSPYGLAAMVIGGVLALGAWIASH